MKPTSHQLLVRELILQLKTGEIDAGYFRNKFGVEILEDWRDVWSEYAADGLLSIDGDRVEAIFFESGALRKTNGRFVWRIDQASGRLNGTFASTAAGSSGKSAATREL